MKCTSVICSMSDEIVGARFGRLTILSDDGVIDGRRRVMAECECGVVKRYRLGDLRSDRTKSCGCLSREAAAERGTTHGMEGMKLYKAWSYMRTRCTASYQERRPSYSGVTHCAEWATFEGFLAHPPPGVFIDGVTVLGRIGDVGEYSPTNARWITKGENIREAHLKHIIDGVPAIDIARRNGIQRCALDGRIRRGWTIEDAATRPVRQWIRNRL